MNFKKSLDGLITRLEGYLESIDNQREKFQIEGIFPYVKQDNCPFDVFLCGKTINVAALILINSINTPNFSKWLKIFDNLLEFTITMPSETWGIYYFYNGLFLLKQHGIYEGIITEDRKKIIKNKMDWRTFVNTSDLSLISKPTNYYGVAFSIAQFREYFGFDDGSWTKALLDKLLTHVEAFSSSFHFMDETEGEGRFDRYSCLIPGELAEHFIRHNQPITPLITKMLRSSADIFIALANQRGDGFMYGRSIGCYGDTASLQLLLAAARANLLNSTEETITINYAIAIAQKYQNFWIDKRMNSLNMWNYGRKTDAYRHRQRILGENFSTAIQVLGALESIEKLGWEEKKYDKSVLENIPDSTQLFEFFKDQNRHFGSLICRRKDLIFHLPLINGSKNYCDKEPYYPIPQMHRVIEASPDSNKPFFWPHFVLEDNSVVSLLVHYNNIRLSNNQLSFSVFGASKIYLNDSIKDDPSTTMKVTATPTLDKRIAAEVNYRFFSDSIAMDIIITKGKRLIKKAIINLGFFTVPTLISTNKITFNDGLIKQFLTDGNLVKKDLIDLANEKTNHGNYLAMAEITWLSPDRLSWQIKF